MEIQIEAVEFRSPEDIRIFPIKVTDKIIPRGKYFARECHIVRRKLLEQHYFIVEYLKKLKEKGQIKSIFHPKNKKIQSQLNAMVKAKLKIKKSLSNLK